jgi:hypothetical protein
MRRSIVTIVSLGLAACVTPSPYAPYECKGPLKKCVGYSQVKLASDTYQVRFEGAASADTRARIEDYTLLRCAELTLESGFEYFVVMQATDATSTETRSSPGTFSAGTTSCSGKGKDKVCVTSPGQWSGGGTYTAFLPGYAYTVQFIADPTGVEGMIIYDARSIQRDLRSKYGLSLAAAPSRPSVSSPQRD